MEHGVAIGTDRTQVRDRVDDVFLAHHRERHQMMHMNVPEPNGSIVLFKGESTRHAAGSVMLNALPPSDRIALIGIDLDAQDRALIQRLGFCDLLREIGAVASVDPVELEQCIGEGGVHEPKETGFRGAAGAEN